MRSLGRSVLLEIHDHEELLAEWRLEEAEDYAEYIAKLNTELETFMTTSSEIENTVTPAEPSVDQTQMAPAQYEIKVVEGAVELYIKSDHDIAAIMKLTPNAALYLGNDITRASEEARKYVAPAPETP